MPLDTNYYSLEKKIVIQLPIIDLLYGFLVIIITDVDLQKCRIAYIMTCFTRKYKSDCR